jgi:hypothetical protein
VSQPAPAHHWAASQSRLLLHVVVVPHSPREATF